MSDLVHFCGCEIHIYTVQEKYANFIVYRNDEIVIREVCDYENFSDMLNEIYSTIFCDGS